MLFDLHVTVVFQPLPMYPLPAICTVGPARLLPPYYITVLQLVDIR